MPFSAATGLAEAALAAGLTSSDHTKATHAQAPVSLAKTMSNRPDRNFGSPLEASKAMKILSPFQCRLAIANRC
jgi:hypothetical protein